MHAMNTAFQECRGCDQEWHQPQSLRSWFTDFTDWMSYDGCSLVTAPLVYGLKVVVPQDQFYECLQEWFETDQGRNEKPNIVLDSYGRIRGWRQFVTPIEISNSYDDGPKYMSDLRKLS